MYALRVIRKPCLYAIRFLATKLAIITSTCNYSTNQQRLETLLSYYIRIQYIISRVSVNIPLR